MQDFKYNFEEDRHIKTEDINEEIIRLPSLIYHYGELKSEADYEVELKKAALEEAKATEYIINKQTQGKITVDHLKAIVDTAPSVIKSRNSYLESKRDADRLKNYIESLRAKKDMLIQLSANSRKE